MKLSELKNNEGKIRFAYQTDAKFYNKYKDKDCVICYSRKDYFPKEIYAIIKGDKFYGLKINTYNKLFLGAEIKVMYKLIERQGIIIVNEKEIGNIKKQIILEAL
jgi:hypothetical protein